MKLPESFAIDGYWSRHAEDAGEQVYDCVSLVIWKFLTPTRIAGIVCGTRDFDTLTTRFFAELSPEGIELGRDHFSALWAEPPGEFSGWLVGKPVDLEAINGELEPVWETADKIFSRLHDEDSDEPCLSRKGIEFLGVAPDDEDFAVKNKDAPWCYDLVETVVSLYGVDLSDDENADG